MKQFTTSSDGTPICYESTGQGETALVFSHGWLGNKDWWLSAARAFEKDYTIVRLDLAGHGESGKEREHFSATLYSDDIAAVASAVPVKNVILVGHSMSGAYVLESAQKVKNTKAIIVVDTLKDLDMVMDPKIMSQIFEGYRRDYAGAVKNALPQFLFAKTTPPEVIARLQTEFLKRDGDFAVKALEPLYRMDVQKFAKLTSVPVRAINSDFNPTNITANRKYFRDYEVYPMSGTGHYPMLEAPQIFEDRLKTALSSF